MGFTKPSLDAAEILAAVTDDSVKWTGANVNVPMMMDFWSTPTDTITITSTATDKTLDNVVIPNITGLTILAAYAMISISNYNDDSGATNRLFNNQYIQVDLSAAGYINAIELDNEEFHCDASTRNIAHHLFIGSIDISSRVDFNATINFKWANADALGNLMIKGLRTGIRIIAI
jgi:hypothetical protein